MKLAVRGALDKMFTGLTGVAVVFMFLVLLLVLGPMVFKGSTAVVFRGTVEFRKMQRTLFARGNNEALKKEIAATQKARQVVYESLDEFKKGLDTEALRTEARRIYRQYGQELRDQGIRGSEYTKDRADCRHLRNLLQEAFESRDIKVIRQRVQTVLASANEPRYTKSCVARYFTMARSFLAAAEKVDLTQFDQYAQSLQAVEADVDKLFGPRPGQPMPPLTRLQYGATRWDQCQQYLQDLLYEVQWVPGPDGRLVQQRHPRAAQFAGTTLEPLFGYISKNIKTLMHPRLTFYWQYFIDDNHYTSHYFGGVGPEILGTLVITLLGMLFVIPLGVTSAAYLVECAPDNGIIRLVRMCINTLAGVPSIVFGLFGMSFFILFLFPKLGLGTKPCMLAASLTLAVLTLPVMIRASEEAIRSVPRSYKEGALALGSSRFRTFITVTLPAALPGILTGVILSLSRVAGETAPILFTGAVASGPVPKSILAPTRTLSYGSYDMAVGDRVAAMVPHNQYGMVVTLVLLILCLNGLAIVLRSRVFKKLKGH